MEKMLNGKEKQLVMTMFFSYEKEKNLFFSFYQIAVRNLFFFSHSAVIFHILHSSSYMVSKEKKKEEIGSWNSLSKTFLNIKANKKHREVCS